MSQFYKLAIKAISKETENAVTISFDIPTELERTFQFKAGQYITLKTTIDGKEVRREERGSLVSGPPGGKTERHGGCHA